MSILNAYNLLYPDDLIILNKSQLEIIYNFTKRMIILYSESIVFKKLLKKEMVRLNSIKIVIKIKEIKGVIIDEKT